jgi:curved DNA-binding protein CbpA
MFCGKFCNYAEILCAYRELALKWHSDDNGIAASRLANTAIPQLAKN